MDFEDEQRSAAVPAAAAAPATNELAATSSDASAAAPSPDADTTSDDDGSSTPTDFPPATLRACMGAVSKIWKMTGPDFYFEQVDDSAKLEQGDFILTVIFHLKVFRVRVRD